MIAISPDDSPEEIRAKAARVVPSERQLAWQRMELTGFVHFGVNTYTTREHGTGTEDPDIFQPHELDTDQWMRAFADAGFKQVILTAKHHDGFLLFPSVYSPFGVASSSWQNGEGDVVRNFAESARKHGLKIGLYISPSDLHEAQPGGRFANGSAKSPRTIPSDPASIVNDRTFDVVADDYNTYFMNTLYELLTRYGDVAEVWWDGANPTGKHNDYNYTDWITIVRTLHPDAAIFQDIDVRWVGNEEGIGRDEEWSPLPLRGDPATAADRFIEPEDPRARDMASDTVLAQRKPDGTSKWDLLRWTPAECDTTIYHDGWFWPTNGVKSAQHLEDIYYTSVGRNCQLLLNVGPDTRGLLDQPALDSLDQLGRTIRETFDEDVTAAARKSWRRTGTGGVLTMNLREARTFDVLSVQEDLSAGMRATSFALDVWNDGWQEVASGTTIGYKKLVRLDDEVTTDRVRLRVSSTRGTPVIASAGLFDRPTN